MDEGNPLIKKRVEEGRGLRLNSDTTERGTPQVFWKKKGGSNQKPKKF